MRTVLSVVAVIVVLVGISFVLSGCPKKQPPADATSTTPEPEDVVAPAGEEIGEAEEAVGEEAEEVEGEEAEGEEVEGEEAEGEEAEGEMEEEEGTEEPEAGEEEESG